MKRLLISVGVIASIALSACSFLDGSNGSLPTVSILSPTSGATVPLNVPVAVQASASDPDGGGVARIDLLVNNVTVDTFEAAGPQTNVSAELSFTSRAEGAIFVSVIAFREDGTPSVPVIMPLQVVGLTQEPESEGQPAAEGASDEQPTADAPPAAEPTVESVPTEAPPTPQPTPTIVPTAPPPVVVTCRNADFGPPGLLQPANGVTVGTLTPTLRWVYSPGGPCIPERYKIDLARVPDFSSISSNFLLPHPTMDWTIDFLLAPDTVYYWRVAVFLFLDDEFSEGPWSEVWSFRTP